MKILLLGGTGAMGAHLARILADMGNEVHITSRRKFANNKSDFAPNIHYICGNAHDLDFVLGLLDSHKYDCVVDFMIYATIEFLDRVELLLGKCVHYVFLSSARVYASSDELLREDSPRLLDISKDKEYLATDEYALTKARQENILAHAHKGNYTIIRPYITFSEIRLQLGVYEKESWLYRAMQGKSIVFFKDIATHYTTMTYALEVARAIAVICGNANAYGQTYHIASEKAVKWEEILAIYQKVLQNELGREIKVVFANLYEFFGKNAYQVIYDRLFDRKFDSSKINALLTQNGEKPLGGGEFRNAYRAVS
ncbi:NAD-dependent epimerase/dehydratase family protein [Helicobacter sp. T3_23-1059]